MACSRSCFDGRYQLDLFDDRDAYVNSKPAIDSPIVHVENVAKCYSKLSLRGNRRVHALKGISLEAARGEVFGLLGPNGAGKTTLVKVLLGVVRPTSGKAAVFGKAAGSKFARSKIGYLPETLRVDRHHSARSALRFYGRLSNMTKQQIDKRSDELLELVGLQGRDREPLKRFSKGMNQRLGLAQALIHDPDLLVLDEPTDGLDPVGRSEVRKVIERLSAAGKTIFLNSHILQEVEVVCTRVAVLADGEIRGSGTIADLAGKQDTDVVLLDVCFDDEVAAKHFIEEASGCHPDLHLRFDPNGSPRGTHRLTGKVTEQHCVDQIVDLVRAGGVSIASLDVKRPSLEDTFMKLVGKATQEDAGS
ncbi:ABC transporter ATP-binding protein [bacterium]|nr:ABC transporter ATP-binding protein [Rubripirellula sp.]MDB4695068.1 ABC transporter ATP-binding protein [bacterium]